MPYNRADACGYALYYWDKVCHDGRVAIGHSPWFVDRVNNVDLKPGLPFTRTGAINREDDCTHFLSCCIGDAIGLGIPRGGGLKLASELGSGVYGIVSTPHIVKELRNQGAKVVGGRDFLPSSASSYPSQQAWDQAKAQIQTLTPGDVIAYASKDNAEAYEHIVLVVGQGPKIACHSYARYGKDWDEISFPWLTLLKMP